MTFQKGQSGNPGGRPLTRVKDGRTLAQMARDHTEEALNTLLEVMRDKTQPGPARVAAADKVLNRGWGQAPQTLTVEEVRTSRDLSDMTVEQLEALRTLRSLADLTSGAAGSC